MSLRRAISTARGRSTTKMPFALVIRYGAVARDGAYLERKFGDVYRGCRSRVRRWL